MNFPRNAWMLTLAGLLVALILAAADLLIISLSIVLLIFAGILFGIFVNAIVRRLPLSYTASYVLFVVAMLAILGGGFYYAGSQVAEQASTLSTELQSASQELRERLSEYDWAQQFMVDREQLAQMVADGGSVGPQLMAGVRWGMWGATGLAVIFFVGLYVAYEPDLYKTGVIKLVAPSRRPRAEEVMEKLHGALSYWIVGRIFSMAIVGICTGIGLWLLNVPLPVTLGVLAAILTFIPNIGPILAAVPQALLALQVGPSTALYVILFNLALQGVESYLVTPIVQRYEVTLPPALTIFAQLLVGAMAGVIGVIMAAPLMVTAMILVQTLYIRDQLGDSDPGELTENVAA